MSRTANSAASQQGADTWIESGDDLLVLEYVDMAWLTTSDFVFA